MALPVDYDTVPVRGRFVYLDGTPAAGRIRFTGKVIMVSDATDTIIIPNSIVTQLGPDGSFEVHIPATDDPDILPHGWTYRVEEMLIAGGGRTYEIDVPLAAQEDGIELSEIAPVTPAHGDPTAFVTLSTFLAHQHDETGGPANPVEWADVVDKPSEFPPETHAHVINDVDGLNDALGNKADALHSHAVSDVSGLTAALNERLSLNRTLAVDPGSTGFLRLNLTYTIDTFDSSDVEQIRVNNVNVCWRNEVGFLRGTPSPHYRDDALVRGRARSDLTNQNGGYLELENSSSQLLHRRRWRDGALVRGNGSGTVVCADVVVLGAVDDVPVGTPTGTVIIRLVD